MNETTVCVFVSVLLFPQADLKANIAKYKRGKFGKGLSDIDVDELDWIESGKKVKAVTIFIYETSV